MAGWVGPALSAASSVASSSGGAQDTISKYNIGNTRVKNVHQRGLLNLFDPGGGIGNTLNMFVPGLFGSKKKQEAVDPLASIRNQLVSLAQTGLPMEEIRRTIGEEFGERREEGLKGIKEEVFAARQAPGSIHASLVTDLVDKLARGESKAMLEAEIANRKFKFGALSSALGAGDGGGGGGAEPDFLESVLPAGAELLGGMLGKKGGEGDVAEFLKNYKPETAEDKKPEELEKGADVIVSPGAAQEPPTGGRLVTI